MIANGTEDARAMVSLAGERDTATQPRAEARESLRPADRRVLVGVLLVALLVRIGALIRTDVIFNDGPVFLRLAAQMQSGQWHAAFAHDQHPGYPLLIRLAQTLFGEPHPAAIAVSMFFGCAAVAALYVFLLQAWDRRVAALGALMLAVNPYAARFSADVQTESVYLFFFLASVTLLFRALRRASPGWAAAAGVSTALAYLTRPEGAAILGVAGVLAAVAWLRGSWAARPTMAWFAALAIGAGVVAGPYVSFVRSVSGGFRVSQKKSLLTILEFAPGSSAEPAGALSIPASTATNEIVVVVLAALGSALIAFSLSRIRGSAATRVRVDRVSLTVAIVALGLLGAVLAPGPFGVFAGVVVSTLRPEIGLLVAIGIFVRAKSGPRGRSLFVTAVVGLYAVILFGLLVSYGYVDRRHALPPLTLLLGYAAAGGLVLIDGLTSWLRGRGLDATRSRVIAWSTIAGLIVAIALPKAWHAHRAEELGARHAAEWLRDHPGAPGKLASGRLKHGWYAGREWMPLWDLGAVKTLDLLDYEGVRFVLAERDVLDASKRPVAPLAENPRFVLVERYTDPSSPNPVVLYELVQRSD